jgi:Osmosensitive K+ channel histidine kinase
MSIIDTDSARAWRIRLAHLRQELLSPVNALLGYAEILHEEASRNGRPDILPDMNRILGAARDLAGKVDRLVDGDRAKSPPGSAAATQEQELRHELRTPLNAIKGYGEMLREDAANFSSDSLRADLDCLLAAPPTCCCVSIASCDSRSMSRRRAWPPIRPARSLLAT